MKAIKIFLAVFSFAVLSGCKKEYFRKDHLHTIIYHSRQKDISLTLNMTREEYRQWATKRE